MTDKPIIFSAPMVRALLKGRKTQTRRVLSIKGRKGFFQFGKSDLPDYDWTFRRADHVWEDWRHDQLLRKLPYAMDDRLWVREAWAPLEALTHNDPGTLALVNRGFYRADCSTVEGEISRWRPSIHMPRWASRLTLIVTDVRVQRLQDISEADARAEGCQPHKMGTARNPSESYHLGFSDLWNSLHGPDAWDANPWVCALIFDVHRCNIDKMGADT